MNTFSTKKIILYSHLVVFGAVALAVILADSYRVWYAGQVYPGVRIAAQSLAGLSSSEIVAFVERLNQRYQAEGLTFNVTDYQGNQHEVNLPLSEDGIPVVSLDSGAVAQQAFRVGRTGDIVDRLFCPITTWVRGGISLSIPLRINRDRFQTLLKERVGPFGESAQNASLTVTSLSPLSVSVVPEKMGRIFDFEELTKRSLAQVGAGSFAPLTAVTQSFLPTINQAEAAELVPRVADYIGSQVLALVATSSADNTPRTWVLQAEDYAPWITISKNSPEGKAVLSLAPSQVQAYLNDTVRPWVDQSAVDARFSIVEGKVTEFQGSQSGIELQTASTTALLNAAFALLPSGTAPTTTVVLQSVDPDITVAEVNDLGLTDVVGVGISSFVGSHPNRIKNLKRAMVILNGILIKPGEEFSTLQALSPFTKANGYLPELVIKGDRIIPEIGGGMCQIGTTMFRLAMNTALPITERRNHSLVVSYYSDPVNHNPGTDATIYDPTVDFKFLNDTGNYLLLQAEADFKKLELKFTFWGKPDGRSGSYTHPVVSKWIPYGATRVVVVPTMKPGTRNCQSPFRGAVASFTYTRTTTLGEKIDEVYTSYYRALPEICMVGPSATAPVGEPCLEGENCAVATEPPTGETIETAPTEPPPVDSAL